MGQIGCGYLSKHSMMEINDTDGRGIMKHQNKNIKWMSPCKLIAKYPVQLFHVWEVETVSLAFDWRNETQSNNSIITFPNYSTLGNKQKQNYRPLHEQDHMQYNGFLCCNESVHFYGGNFAFYNLMLAYFHEVINNWPQRSLKFL